MFNIEIGIYFNGNYVKYKEEIKMAKKKRKATKKAKAKVEEPKIEEAEVETTATKGESEVVKEVEQTREQMIVQACQFYGVGRNDVVNVQDVEGGIVIELKPPMAKKLKYPVD